jgi:hypothetical protein
VSKRLDYTQIAPAGAKALGGVYGYVMQSGLPATLVDLVYPRVPASAQACTSASFSTFCPFFSRSRVCMSKQ